MKKDDGWAVVWNFRINSLMSPCVSVRTPGKLVEKDNGWVVSNYHRIVIVPGNHKRFLTLRVFLWRLAVSRFYQFSDIDTVFTHSLTYGILSIYLSAQSTKDNAEFRLSGNDRQEVSMQFGGLDGNVRWYVSEHVDPVVCAAKCSHPRPLPSDTVTASM